MEALLPLLGLCLIALAAWQLGGDGRKRVREGLSGAQTVAGLTIILIGVSWYLRERPDAPRVELEIAATAYPVDNYPDVLVRAVFTLQNNGRAALALDRGKTISFQVRRLTPFDPASVEAQLRGPTPEGAARVIDFPRFATIRQDQLGLDHMLETGEPESLSYYTILNCEKEQRVLVRGTMIKPMQFYEKALTFLGLSVPNSIRDTQFWSAETMVDLTEACEAASRQEASG